MHLRYIGAVTSPNMSTMNQLADAVSDNDQYYLKSVTEFSETSEVVSSEDIYSQTGIKLINKGARLNQSFYEQLLKHKLAIQPIDRSLTVKGAVSPLGLALDAARLLDEETQMSLLANAMRDPRLLRHTLEQISLNPTLAFKLTLAREKRPALYRHSLRIALISIFFGIFINLKQDELVSLATAAIFHDLGELHIDPSLLDSELRLDAQKRQHIYAHPMIAYLILREYPEYHPTISYAVLDHHERLDGSGYPRNIKGAKIGMLGQILAVAELAGSLCGDNNQGNAWAHVEVILKLNHDQFRGDLRGCISALARQRPAIVASEASAELPRIRTSLENITTILSGWNQTYIACNKGKSQEYLDYTHERMGSLEKGLFGSGFNPAEPDLLTDNIEEDPRSLAELNLLMREAKWQMNDAICDIRRRWPELETTTDPAALALCTWVNLAEQLLEQETTSHSRKG